MILLRYLKMRRYMILLFLLCSGIHMTVQFIYGQRVEPVLYASAIYGVIVFCLGIFDYVFWRKKYMQIKTYDINMSTALIEWLPRGDYGEEYQDIIRALNERLKACEQSYMQKEGETRDFYTMWVHQIKTPIAALRLLLQTSPENITAIKGEVFKIERYVDIILNYLRMENLNGDLLLKHYSLENMTKQAVKKYTPLFIQSKLKVELVGLEGLVLTDEKWLVFVIEQLLSNAIKYTKTGGIRIYARETWENKTKISELFVEDTGIGIYPEDIPRIFERTFTGYNGRGDKQASGLGLYLCKTILQKLCHEITVTSVVGKGTCVKITFRENAALRGNLTKL